MPRGYIDGDGCDVEPLGNKPAEFAALLKRDEPVWRDAVTTTGITPE